MKGTIQSAAPAFLQTLTKEGNTTLYGEFCFNKKTCITIVLWEHLRKWVILDFRKRVTYDCELEREMGIH